MTAPLRRTSAAHDFCSQRLHQHRRRQLVQHLRRSPRFVAAQIELMPGQRQLMPQLEAAHGPQQLSQLMLQQAWALALPWS